MAGAIKNLTEDLAGVICDGAKAALLIPAVVSLYKLRHQTSSTLETRNTPYPPNLIG